MVGTVSAARRERRGVSPPGGAGGGRGQSGAVGTESGCLAETPRALRAGRGAVDVDARGPAALPARAEKMPVEAHATGPIARGGSGGHASRRTISGSARSMCREVPLWYPRARDGTATVCSMARARLPKARRSNVWAFIIGWLLSSSRVIEKKVYRTRRLEFRAPLEKRRTRRRRKSFFERFSRVMTRGDIIRKTAIFS